MKRLAALLLLLCFLSGCGVPSDGFTVETEHAAPPMDIILATAEPASAATEATQAPTTEPTEEPDTVPPTEETEPTAEPTTQPTEAPTEAPLPAGHDYVLNTNSKKFHYPSCGSVRQMKAKNRRDYRGSREEIINMGYSPCKNCKP